MATLVNHNRAPERNNDSSFLVVADGFDDYDATIVAAL